MGRLQEVTAPSQEVVPRKTHFFPLEGMELAVPSVTSLYAKLIDCWLLLSYFTDKHEGCKEANMPISQNIKLLL